MTMYVQIIEEALLKRNITKQ